MTLTLTAAELHEITGYKTVARQIRELQSRGWVFEINAAGRIIVSRAYAEQRLGARPADTPADTPNFDAIRRQVA